MLTAEGAFVLREAAIRRRQVALGRNEPEVCVPTIGHGVIETVRCRDDDVVRTDYRGSAVACPRWSGEVQLADSVIGIVLPHLGIGIDPVGRVDDGKRGSRVFFWRSWSKFVASRSGSLRLSASLVLATRLVFRIPRHPMHRGAFLCYTEGERHELTSHCSLRRCLCSAISSTTAASPNQVRMVGRRLVVTTPMPTKTTT